MAWKTNRKVVSEGFSDLKYLPRERCGWDSTLACLSYRMRMAVERRLPDLNAWAARHGVRASGRYRDLGSDALVLWHGTSRERAEKILEHGLFHKKGLWTAVDPGIPHVFCRGRSERFRTEGAVVCLVVDRNQLIEGRDFDVEGGGKVFRFHHGLPPDVVEYVLVHDEIRFTGEAGAREPTAWRRARFKKRSGAWVPVQKTPVRYSESTSYSSVREFARLCMDRLLRELTEVSALEIFSAVYATVAPWEALTHQDILGLIQERCLRCRQRHKWPTFRARSPSQALHRAA